MYNTLLWFQGLSIAAVFLTMVVFFPTWKNRIHAYLFIYSLSVAVNNIGYFIVMSSGNPITTLWGTKIEYMGKLFISAALLFFMTEYTGARISEYTKRTVVVIHALIGVLVFTCEHHSMYYENGPTYMDFWTTEGLFPHVKLQHGIFYYMYVMMVAGYLLFATFSAIRQLVHERRHKRKIQTAIIISCGLVMLAGILVYSTGVMGGYDATVISYLVCLVLMIIATIKYDLIAALDAVKNYIADNMTEGIVAVDTEGAIIYNNAIAERIYPSLREKDETVITQLIEAFEKDEVISIKKSYFKVEQSDLTNERKTFGKLYVIDDVTVEYNHNKELKLRSITDGMTGLFNRTETMRRIEEAMASGNGVSLVMIDIDNFKSVNDSYGHDVGDTVIKGVAKIMLDLTYIDPKLSAGRWGGEEFMLVMPASNIDEAFDAAEKIRLAFAETEFQYAGFRTVSLGVTSYTEEDDADGFCKRADEALYTSKQEGKNRTTVK
ncbi:MAG: diguanylate cyclase [Lachnospiraceae bacterium]|nr:diguanylate cyclase [Lachnospiraceae bacterium]